MPIVDKILLNIEIFDIQRQNLSFPKQNLRLYGGIVLVQPHVQMERVVGVAVVYAEPVILPRCSGGGDVAAAKGFQQHPGGADRGELVVRQQGEVKGCLAEGQRAVITVDRFIAKCQAKLG